MLLAQYIIKREVLLAACLLVNNALDPHDLNSREPLLVHGSSKQILAAPEIGVWTQRNTLGRAAFQSHHEIDLNSVPTNGKKNPSSILPRLREAAATRRSDRHRLMTAQTQLRFADEFRRRRRQLTNGTKP
jgi:hypothetical protein